MIRKLLDVIPAGNRKYPIRYRRAMNIIFTRLDYLRLRFLNMELTNSPGVNLLKALLTNVDLRELDSYASDLDRYTNVIQFYKNSRLQQFDPVYSGKFTTNYFTNGAGNYGGVIEVLLDLDTRHPFNTFPLDKDWSEWQELRSLRVLMHDSLELPEIISSSRIVFKQDAPTMCVMSIDVPVFIFKYYKYWKNCQEAGVAFRIEEFLKRYEYANFFEDLLDIWLLNVITLVYTSRPQNLTITERVSKLTVPSRVATDNVLHELLSGIDEYVDLYERNTFHPQDMIDSPWLANGQTYRERINSLYEAALFPPQRNYKWCEALFWLPYIAIITRATVVFPSSSTSNQILTRARNLWRTQFRFASLVSVARGTTVKLAVEALLEELESCLTGRAIP